MKKNKFLMDLQVIIVLILIGITAGIIGGMVGIGGGIHLAISNYI